MLGGDRRGGGRTQGPAAGRRVAAQTLQQDRAAQGVGPGAWRDVWAKQTLASRLAGSPSLQSCPLPPPAAHARLSCFFPLFLFPVYISVSFFSLTLLFFFLPFFLF